MVARIHGQYFGYPIAYVDADNEVSDGSRHNYAIRFDKKNIPPARYCWSVTLYNKQADGVAGYMAENPVNRYLINSTTEGLVKDKDGNFTIFIQHEPPTDKERKANWLPAPTSRSTLYCVFMAMKKRP